MKDSKTDKRLAAVTECPTDEVSPGLSVLQGF